MSEIKVAIAEEDQKPEFEFENRHLMERIRGQGYQIGGTSQELAEYIASINGITAQEGIGEDTLYKQNLVLADVKKNLDGLRNVHGILLRSIDDIELSAYAKGGSLDAIIRKWFRKNEQKIDAYDLVDREYEVGVELNEGFKCMVESNLVAMNNLVAYASGLSSDMEFVAGSNVDAKEALNGHSKLGEELRIEVQEQRNKGKGAYVAEDLSYQADRKVQLSKAKCVMLSNHLDRLMQYRPEAEVEICRAISATALSLDIYQAVNAALNHFHAMAPVQLNLIRDGKMTQQLRNALRIIRSSSLALEKEASAGYHDLQNFSFTPTIRKPSQNKKKRNNFFL